MSSRIHIVQVNILYIYMKTHCAVWTIVLFALQGLVLTWYPFRMKRSVGYTFSISFSRFLPSRLAPHLLLNRYKEDIIVIRGWGQCDISTGGIGWILYLVLKIRKGYMQDFKGLMKQLLLIWNAMAFGRNKRGVTAQTHDKLKINNMNMQSEYCNREKQQSDQAGWRFDVVSVMIRTLKRAQLQTFLMKGLHTACQSCQKYRNSLLSINLALKVIKSNTWFKFGATHCGKVTHPFRHEYEASRWRSWVFHQHINAKSLCRSSYLESNTGMYKTSTILY